MTKRKTVLVTGGAGYIGSHAALTLVEHGYDVVVLDNLSTGAREAVPDGATFVEGDVADEALVASLVRIYGIRDVLHFAAFVDVAESVREPELYHHNNYEKTRALLAAAKAAGVERFIFSSTAAVYGNPDIVPVPESARTEPESPYGTSKLFAERAVAKSGMQYAILRYFNVAGTNWQKGIGYRTDKEPTHLIRRVVLAMLGKLDCIEVFGTDYPTHDGTAVRDYIHVRDLVQAHVDVLRYLECGGKPDVFNVGYGDGRTVLQVIEAASKIRQTPLEYLLSQRRPGDSMMVVADNSKLVKRVDWRPMYQSLGGMIRDEYDWVKSQEAQASP